MKVGIARAMITPDGPTWMSGFRSREHKSEGAYDDITATAVVFDNGSQRVGFMALDVLAVDDFLLVPVREAAQEAGIAPDAMMINTSHTHCGPAVTRIRCHVRKFDEEYLQWLKDRLCALVGEAVDDLQEATLDYTVGSATMGINRRRKGESGLLPNPDRPIDLDVPVLRVLTPDGEVRGLIFSYACHPSTTGGYLIGPDYPGFARQHIEGKIPGSTAVFLQGCGGDVKPRVVNAEKRFQGAEIAEVAEVGHEIARAVFGALCREPQPVGETLAAADVTAQLPFDHQPTERELAEAREGTAFQKRWAEAVQEIYDRGETLIDTLPIEVQVLRIGDIYLIGTAGETCVEIGLGIKSRLPDMRVMTLGYTNGGWDYLAPAEAFEWGNYEGVRSFADTIWPDPQPLGFAPEAETILVDTACEAARSLTD
ncbi:MAG: hypothetical protein ACLFWB_06635 [Armatimonadota bacterium]